MDALDTTALPQVLVCLEDVRTAIVGARTYLFGSITTDRRPAGDIDVLVICAQDEDCAMARVLLSPACEVFPIHLTIMTPSEEAELSFILGVRAVEVLSPGAGSSCARGSSSTAEDVQTSGRGGA